MDSKLTRQQVLNLHSGLKNVSFLKGAKFAYAVVKNFQKLIPVISSFAFTDKFVEFEKKRSEILKDTVDPLEVDKKINDLKKEYKSTIEEAEKYLEEEITVDLFKIPLSYIPEDIDAKLFDPILPIVEE